MLKRLLERLKILRMKRASVLLVLLGRCEVSAKGADKKSIQVEKSSSPSLQASGVLGEIGSTMLSGNYDAVVILGDGREGYHTLLPELAASIRSYYGTPAIPILPLFLSQNPTDACRLANISMDISRCKLNGKNSSLSIAKIRTKEELQTLIDTMSMLLEKGKAEEISPTGVASVYVDSFLPKKNVRYMLRSFGKRSIDSTPFLNKAERAQIIVLAPQELDESEVKEELEEGFKEFNWLDVSVNVHRYGGSEVRIFGMFGSKSAESKLSDGKDGIDIEGDSNAPEK